MEAMWTSSQTQETAKSGVPIPVSLSLHQAAFKPTIGHSCAGLRAHCTIMSLLRDKAIEPQTDSSAGKCQRVPNYQIGLELWP
jgi:hypothetical protein